MTRRELRSYNPRIDSFEDLRGLRAEGYVRDSTLDQRDGFGPTIQRTNEQRLLEAGQQMVFEGGTETEAIKEALEKFHATRLLKLLEYGILAPAKD